MILYRGEICEDKELPRLLERLEADCLETIAGQTIDRETVVAACDALARRAEAGDYDSVLQPFLAAFSIDPARFREALFLFKREALSYKLAVELGPEDLPDLTPPGRAPIRRRRMPLGVLFHMAAGNVDGLPAYSVVEGLLAGNVNILKLPAQDRGASLLLLRELVRLEPRLRDFVYVFDVPSADLKSLERFAKIADAVVVWGGDEAVRAARALAGPDTALICWGHKLSFAYAVPPVSDGDLEALADHICATGQLLCSSCQGIFLDTGDMGEVYALAERFFPHPPGRRPPASSGGPGPPGPGHAGALRPGAGGGQRGTADLSWRRRQRHRGAGQPAGAGASGGELLGEAPAPGPDRPPAQAPEGLSPDRRAPLSGGGAGGPVRPPGPGRRGPGHRSRGHVPDRPGGGPRWDLPPGGLHPDRGGVLVAFHRPSVLYWEKHPQRRSRH